MRVKVTCMCKGGPTWEESPACVCMCVRQRQCVWNLVKTVCVKVSWRKWEGRYSDAWRMSVTSYGVRVVNCGSECKNGECVCFHVSGSEGASGGLHVKG